MTGKQKCEMLKQLRREIAEANGIVYLSAECTYTGDCPGFCPKCDAEARYLDSELNRLASEGKQIKVTDISYQSFLNKVGNVSNSEENNTTDDQLVDIGEILGEEEVVLMGEKVLEITIKELELSVRTFNCLKRAGIKTVTDLTNRTRSEVMRIRNLGKFGFEEITSKLHALGLDYKEELLTGMMVETSESIKEKVMQMTIDELDFTVRTSNRLHRSGILTLGELVECSASDLRKFSNFEEISITEIEGKLQSLGLTLKNGDKF